jgi:hypothetical protein
MFICILAFYYVVDGFSFRISCYLGLRSENCNAESDIGKWLTNFFGLPFLKPDEIEDCFVEDLFSEAPQDSRCEQFAD